MFEGSPYHVGPHIAHALVRLDALASTIDGSRKPRTPPSAIAHAIPSVFADFDDVRHSLTCQIVSIYHFKVETADRYRYWAPESIPIYAIAESYRLTENLQRWNTSFSAMSPPPKTPSIQQQRDILLLQFNPTLMTLATCLYAEESIYDKFDAEFATIVSTTSSILQARHSATPSTRAPPFSITLDQALLHPLITTALKCRHPSTRARALSLLQSLAAALQQRKKAAGTP